MLSIPPCFIRCLTVLHPFPHFALDVLNIRNFVFLSVIVGDGFLTGVILAPVFSFGKCPWEWARRSWWHCSAQRLQQQGKSVIRLQQALDQLCSKETVSTCCYFLKISLAWSRDHIQRALISPSGLLVGPSPGALWLQGIPKAHVRPGQFLLFILSISLSMSLVKVAPVVEKRRTWASPHGMLLHFPATSYFTQGNIVCRWCSHKTIMYHSVIIQMDLLLPGKPFCCLVLGARFSHGMVLLRIHPVPRCKNSTLITLTGWFAVVSFKSQPGLGRKDRKAWRSWVL